MEKGDKGSTMIRMGVSGWMFLLVPAYPGCPGSKAVKRSLLLLLSPAGWLPKTGIGDQPGPTNSIKALKAHVEKLKLEKSVCAVIYWDKRVFINTNNDHTKLRHLQIGVGVRVAVCKVDDVAITWKTKRPRQWVVTTLFVAIYIPVNQAQPLLLLHPFNSLFSRTTW